MSETELLGRIATLLEDQKQSQKATDDLLNRIFTILEDQRDDSVRRRDAQNENQRQRDAIQLYSGLSVVGSIIASLSLSLLTYAATLSQANSLDNKSLFALDLIWLVTTGASLFLAGAAGIVAAIFGAVNPRNLRSGELQRKGWRSPRFSDGFVIVCLFTVLVTMIAGLIQLSNDFVVNTPGGHTQLEPQILYPLFTIGLILMVVLVYWMVYTRYTAVKGEIHSP